jgi:hypothetical protein
VPVASRLAGPTSSFLFVLIDASLCCALWTFVWLMWRGFTRGNAAQG